MPRRRAQPAQEIRRLTVAETAVTFDYSEHGKASHSMLISGEIDRPVLRTQTVAITVLALREDEKNGAAAIGVTDGVWRIVASIDHRDFAILLTIAAGRLLTWGELASEPIRRGRGRIHSMTFSTSSSS